MTSATTLARPLDPAPTPEQLLALFTDPAVAARRACDVRARAFHGQIWIRPAPALASDAPAVIVRGADTLPAPGHVPSDMSHKPALWPDPRDLRPGDRLLLRVEHDQLPAYCAWLIAAADARGGWTLTPFCAQPGGLFRLHLIAAARLALPTAVRVEVRHDLHGVRLAQVALGFGADTLAGPIDIGRHLPLAGIPRPSETSADALCELVRQAGLEPITDLSETPS